MFTKTLTIEAMEQAGRGLARIATLSAIDSDGDTYARGAFGWKEGGHQWAAILPAHDRRHVSLGKARIYEEGDHAMAELIFNLDIPQAKAWHSAIMFDLANGLPVQEYSYGYDVLDAEKAYRDGADVRLLKRLDVHEISPVLKGAGEGTGTILMKNAALKGAAFAQLLADMGCVADALQADPSILSATGRKQLDELHAALGKALAPPRQEAAADDDALAGYLLNLSRGHLGA